MAEAAAVSPPDLRRAARRGLAVYFALIVVLSGSVEAYMIMNPEVFGTTAGILTLMWTPALASVIARLVLREGFSDVSFRSGGSAPCRGTRWAWACPSPSGSSPTAPPG